MKTGNEIFGTAFNCMDGRCQDAVAAYVRQKFNVDYVDAITEPGRDGILAGKKVDVSQPDDVLKWLRFKAQVSAKGHGSRHAVVVGHSKCAGNNTSNDEHQSDIRRAVEAVQGWNLFETVVGLFAFESGSTGWTVVEVPLS
jgi:hypothetical protein